MAAGAAILLDLSLIVWMPLFLFLTWWMLANDVIVFMVSFLLWWLVGPLLLFWAAMRRCLPPLMLIPIVGLALFAVLWCLMLLIRKW